MGCGIGACFACVCETTEQMEVDYVKVCSDGPVFPCRSGVKYESISDRITRSYH